MQDYENKIQIQKTIQNNTHIQQLLKIFILSPSKDSAVNAYIKLTTLENLPPYVALDYVLKVYKDLISQDNNVYCDICECSPCDCEDWFRGSK